MASLHKVIEQRMSHLETDPTGSSHGWLFTAPSKYWVLGISARACARLSHVWGACAGQTTTNGGCTCAGSNWWHHHQSHTDRRSCDFHCGWTPGSHDCVYERTSVHTEGWGYMNNEYYYMRAKGARHVAPLYYCMMAEWKSVRNSKNTCPQAIGHGLHT